MKPFLHVINDIERVSQELVEIAKHFPTATIGEAYGGKGALSHSIKPIRASMVFCGTVIPVAARPGDNLIVHKAIYIAQPGDVLLVDTSSYLEAGFWGGIMTEAAKLLDRFGIGHEVVVSSAHRQPEKTRAYATSARERGLRVIIAGAGMAAHLAGVIAASTDVPVIGVPLGGSALNGVDALYSMVQMPGGVPVGTMAIGKAGAKNAAIYAAKILALADDDIARRLKEYREELAQ